MRVTDALGLGVIFLASAAWIIVLSSAYGGENACEMSYMHPHFARAPDVVLASSAHALHRYRDLRDAREASNVTDACVVRSLFVPGTSGSHAQARSVGSGTRDGSGTRGCVVEHYALDFAREMSAHSGTLLARQGASVEAALRWMSRDGAAAATTVVGHSAGGLAAMDAVANLELARDRASGFEDASTSVDAMIHLAVPLAWNPVSLTLDAWMRERAARRRWRASGARSRVVLVSVVGGARDRQVSSLAMGYADDLVDDGLGISASAPRRANVRASFDHQCAAWCKQLVTAVANGFANAFPMARPKQSPRDIARGFRRALGDTVESSVGVAFGVPARFYETVQERTPSLLAGFVATTCEPSLTVTNALTFVVLAHVSSPGALRAKPLESAVASLATLLASGWIARRRFFGALGAHRALAASQVLAYIPSLIAWAHHVSATFARAAAAADVAPPFGVADVLALGASLAPLATSRRPSPPSRLTVHIAWLLAACASAPGNGGLARAAVAVLALDAARPASRRKRH